MGDTERQPKILKCAKKEINGIENLMRSKIEVSKVVVLLLSTSA